MTVRWLNLLWHKPDSVLQLKKKAKKAPIVQQKNDKRCLDLLTLRDYMNFKSGKTRKDNKKPVRTEAFKKKNPAGMMGDSFKVVVPSRK